MRKAFFSVAGFVLLLVAGCDSYKSPGNLPTVPVTIGAKTYTVEIAADDAVREHGLMQRDSMPRNWGMIFVFEDDQPRGFWMHNTRIPLDILFVQSDGKIVSIHTMKPYDESTTRSKGAAKYAIELNAGEAKACGAKEGDMLVIPAEAKDIKK